MKKKIAVLGLGYVGLPLAVEFSKHFTVVGYDLSAQRINELRNHYDVTLETTEEQLRNVGDLTYTDQPSELASCDVYIVTVPTPVDSNKKPDLSYIVGASEMVAPLLNGGDVVIYESTVFPGATEEVCMPILQSISGLKYNVDFFLGYSPERINPGDKEHSLTKILKVTSGSNSATADFVDSLYSTIITAGTHKASSIKVAEAAKVIENTQRDLNIALINELAIIFERLDIDTEEVLSAARTKWNFLDFRPGLVGGHCIGVDPYYLTYKSQQLGYEPEVILAGRRINDSMGEYIANQLVREMLGNEINLVGARVLVMGLTFKEDCPDIRNTKVTDVINALRGYSISVDVYDPWVDKESVTLEGIELVGDVEVGAYDAVVLAVKHRCFLDLGAEKIRRFCKGEGVVYDLKSAFEKELSNKRL